MALLINNPFNSKNIATDLTLSETCLLQKLRQWAAIHKAYQFKQLAKMSVPTTILKCKKAKKNALLFNINFWISCS